jgi:hypothetical protein
MIKWEGNLTCSNIPTRMAISSHCSSEDRRRFPNTLMGWVMRVQYFFYGELRDLK